jgi:carboxypeptidase Q
MERQYQRIKKAEVILVKLKDSTSLEAYRGKLKNKIIMMEPAVMASYTPSFKADAHRYEDAELQKMADEKPAAPGAGGRGGGPFWQFQPWILLRAYREGSNTV